MANRQGTGGGMAPQKGLLGDVKDFFLGTKKEATTGTTKGVSTKKTDEVKTGKTTTKGATETGAVTGTEQLQTGSTLGAGAIEQLTSLLGTITAGGLAQPQELETSLLTQLAARAGGADEALAASRGDIVGRARTVGERKLGQQGQAFAGQAGSSMNTLVQQLQAEGSTDLETSLAALTGQLERSDRALGTEELGMATELAGGAAGGRADIATSLAEALKGGETTKTLAGKTESQTTQNTISQILEKIKTGTTTKGAIGTVTTGTTKQGSSILDFLNLLK